MPDTPQGTAARGYGKNAVALKALREAIGRGEHSHHLAVHGPTKCWNGTTDCLVWHDQGDRDADF